MKTRSKRFSQIVPGSVTDPNAVKVSSKFTMIPTVDDVIEEEEAGEVQVEKAKVRKYPQNNKDFCQKRLC